MSTVLVCPGYHDPSLTQRFLSHLKTSWKTSQNLLLYPVAEYPPYSGPHIIYFLHQHLRAQGREHWQKAPIIFLGFSAGVVGAIGAALGWEKMGGRVRSLIAVDGWGVPLVGKFPIHRVSHDYFTHWSSAILGAGADSFYADPGVEHLELWRSPHTAKGWRVSPHSVQPKLSTTAAEFLALLLLQYEK